MGKKPKAEDGAPAYMGLFAMLMIMLLAFFIVLNTLAKDQDSGFKASGVGAVRNAFGLKGGFGLMSYSFMNQNKEMVPVPDNYESKEGQVGFHRDTVEGEGGPGNIDQDVDEKNMGGYLRVIVPTDFAPAEQRVTDQMATYLKRVGHTLNVMKYQLTIRCFANESADPGQNQALALKRAAVVMRYMNSACQIPFERMRAVGYAHKTYFLGRNSADEIGDNSQALYLYLFEENQNAL